MRGTPSISRPTASTYGTKRYTEEVGRHYAALNQRLDGGDYVAGDYSIADIAIWPWIVPWRTQGQNLDEHRHLKACSSASPNGPRFSAALPSAATFGEGRASGAPHGARTRRTHRLAQGLTRRFKAAPIRKHKTRHFCPCLERRSPHRVGRGTAAMIDFYTWATPNGRKVAIMLEECGLGYAVHPIDLGAGEQHGEAFTRISPNHKIPAIVDRKARGGPAGGLRIRRDPHLSR